MDGSLTSVAVVAAVALLAPLSLALTRVTITIPSRISLRIGRMIALALLSGVLLDAAELVRSPLLIAPVRSASRSA